MERRPKEIIVQAPGRINLIGEHTDYNNGFVMPAAIDKKMKLRLNCNNTTSSCKVLAENVKETFEFDLKSIAPVSRGGWRNYVLGVVSELQKLGAEIEGFDAIFDGDVPIGSGMSSSAALECSLAYGLNELFALGFDKWQLIKAAQMAEHHFVGTKCGIMDQFASMMGKKNQVMLLDCRSLEFQYFPLDLGDYQLLLLNTNVAHSLASSEYNTRRSECEEGLRILQQRYPGAALDSLRDVTFEQVQQAKELFPLPIFKRCKHIVLENDRVLQASQALSNKDFNQLGELMYQSHTSLQIDYEVSCPELDFLVQQTMDENYVLGSRMMGGGFGGCTINVIEKKRADEFTELAAKEYRNRFGIDLTPYTVSVENGAEIITK